MDLVRRDISFWLNGNAFGLTTGADFVYSAASVFYPDVLDTLGFPVVLHGVFARDGPTGGGALSGYGGGRLRQRRDAAEACGRQRGSLENDRGSHTSIVGVLGPVQNP